MGLFNLLKKESIYITLQMNARLQPLDRDGFENVVEKTIKKKKYGIITGGGSMLLPTKEIAWCDVEFEIYKDKVDEFISYIKDIQMIPKGSKLIFDDEKEIEIGTSEGLGLYLNGCDLPSEVYKNNDINVLIEKLDEILKECAIRLSYWEGPKETALYYYGKDYNEMKEKIQSIIESYPLCEKCRIERIA